MKFSEFKRTSNYLIVLSSLILILGVYMAFLVYNTKENLKHDAQLINETGVVRGSIQRVTKLVLAGADESAIAITIQVDRLINRLENSGVYSENKDYAEHIVMLESCWGDLKNAIKDFQNNALESSENSMLKASETCWHIADSLVFDAQANNESKVASISLFYFILLVNGVSTLNLILLVFAYVRKKLEFESARDPLTSIFNRRTYNNVIAYELSRCRRSKKPISLIMLDIDHFKEINDNHGHKTGDRVLMELVQLIKKMIRKSYTVFRIGGEEFAIVSPETNAQGAYNLSEKIRETVARHQFNGLKQITISLGIAEFFTNVTKEVLFQNADAALYEAKHNGRNKSVIYGQSLE